MSGVSFTLSDVLFLTATKTTLKRSPLILGRNIESASPCVGFVQFLNRFGCFIASCKAVCAEDAYEVVSFVSTVLSMDDKRVVAGDGTDKFGLGPDVLEATGVSADVRFSSSLVSSTEIDIGAADCVVISPLSPVPSRLTGSPAARLLATTSSRL